MTARKCTICNRLRALVKNRIWDYKEGEYTYKVTCSFCYNDQYIREMATFAVVRKRYEKLLPPMNQEDYTNEKYLRGLEDAT